MELDYQKFNKLDDLEKTTFLEEWIDSPPDLESISEKNTRYFLRDIIERETNNYLKKLSVDILSFLTAANIMKKSSIISILLDIDDDSFVEVNALKYLYYFYDNNVEIKAKFKRCTSSDNGDICSEAYYRLGLIEFLNNISLDNKLEYFNCIEKSSVLFRSAYEIVENREDAHYFYEVTNFIKAILSNDEESSEETFKNLYNISFKRRIFTYNPKFIILEDKIQSILHNIYRIFNTSTRHQDWIDYKKQFGELAQFYFEMLNTSLATENTQNKLIRKFKSSVNSNILEQLFIQNFSFYTRKIEAIQNNYKNDEILNEFLEVILNTIQKKKKEPTADIIGICIKLREVLGDDISIDVLMEKLKNLDDLSNIQDVLNIVKEYIQMKHEETFDVITGDHTGQEVYLNIKQEIEAKLPDYSEKKLNVFLRILEETIKYLVLSIKSKRNDRFKYLYTIKNKGLGDTASEKDFQDSLYEHFTYSNIAYGAQEEVINFADGGRIDIVFKINNNTFPIELKKTKDATTKEAIREKYLNQIHSYLYGYDQLGIFAVLDLTEKDAPINDIRDLVYLDNLTPLYDLESKYPDYIVVIVIPGNKHLPSEKSTYK
ncbi:hypothetical protein [Sporosarcina newyorkensis]|uniref:hypothetical protein n=1 Tax=Sporosarcina newyorkensis TaxID=759851 RepID=UPI003CFC49F6